MMKQSTYNLGSQRKVGIVITEFNKNKKIIARANSSSGRSIGTSAKETCTTKGGALIDQIVTKRCYIDHN